MSDEAQAPVAENVADTATNEGGVTTEAPTSSLRDALSSHLGEGAEAPAWMGKYADDAALANGIFAGQSMIGKKGDIPSEGSAPEAYAEFADKMGFKPIEGDKEYVSLSSERFGDSKAQLEPMYNQGIRQVMDKAIENFRANPSPQAFEDALTEWANGDAEATIQSIIDGNKATSESFNSTAARMGLTPEQLAQSNEETAKRYGWTEGLDMNEVLYTLAKSTSNSTTLQDAHLNNTTEGLQAQVDELQIELQDRSVSAAQHEINLKKMKSLLERQGDLLKRG
jgi:hypothetical protein